MSAMPDLKGKVAVVTGGASGIGKGIATRLVSAGAHVVIADIEDEALQKTAADIGAMGVQTDVRDYTSVQALADRTIDTFGAVHLVVNNAGVGPMAPIAQVTMDDWKWMIDVNLYGVIHGVNVFLPLLLANGGSGHIVNTASTGGLVAMPALGPYCVTKFGVVALTETLAQELAGTCVGASILVPGPVHTNIQTSSRNRDRGERGLVDVDLADIDAPFEITWLDPLDVAQIVIDGIARGDLYIITHPGDFAQIEARHASIAAAYGRS